MTCSLNGALAADESTAGSGYTNRPSIRSQAPRRLRLESSAGGRAVDRMRLALHAYEQRAEQRAALRGWLAARAALSSQT
jgi:hypothetical protein